MKMQKSYKPHSQQINELMREIDLSLYERTGITFYLDDIPLKEWEYLINDSKKVSRCFDEYGDTITEFGELEYCLSLKRVEDKITVTVSQRFKDDLKFQISL